METSKWAGEADRRVNRVPRELAEVESAESTPGCKDAAVVPKFLLGTLFNLDPQFAVSSVCRTI
jgi:hypothetical protein